VTATRAVRVRTEVAAVGKDFDYTVPDTWSHDVRVGTRLRVPLHGRSVRGWVVDADVEPPAGVEVLPAKSWLGWGPPPDVVEVAQWAAWRWAGPESFFLRSASSPTIVRNLPPVPTIAGGLPGSETARFVPWADAVSSRTPAIVRLPPSTDLLDLVLSVVDAPTVLADGGSVVVLVPGAGWAERLTERLNRRGRPATTRWDEARAGWPVVVGNRAAAWTPVPRLAAAIVLDAHDEAYREESAPTYSAVDVLIERSRRAGAPCLLVSPVPPVWLSGPDGPHAQSTIEPTSRDERAGWPAVELVDRRAADPRTGMFSEEFVRLARRALEDAAAVERGPLVCVYNRTGGARMLACRHCGEVARCTRCGSAAQLDRDHEVLRCPRCHETRPVVCQACGRLRMKTLRVGVTRLREELTALLGVQVDEVSGSVTPEDTVPGPSAAPVLVGTEAVLHRVRRAAAVAFLDVDLHLLASRLTATEETLALFVRAARLVGPRGSGPASARVLAQTRVPDHPVLSAVASGEPAPLLADELAMREAAGLPPFSAFALLSGTQAASYAEALAASLHDDAVSVAPLGDGRYLAQAARHAALCDLLDRVARPPGRGLRVEVDPATL
jgi:primosomal protein N' (replication factor Y) (superfamily II helicase)